MWLWSLRPRTRRLPYRLLRLCFHPPSWLPFHPPSCTSWIALCCRTLVPQIQSCTHTFQTLAFCLSSLPKAIQQFLWRISARWWAPHQCISGTGWCTSTKCIACRWLLSSVDVLPCHRGNRTFLVLSFWKWLPIHRHLKLASQFASLCQLLAPRVWSGWICLCFTLVYSSTNTYNMRPVRRLRPRLRLHRWRPCLPSEI